MAIMPDFTFTLPISIIVCWLVHRLLAKYDMNNWMFVLDFFQTFDYNRYMYGILGYIALVVTLFCINMTFQVPSFIIKNNLTRIIAGFPGLITSWVLVPFDLLFYQIPKKLFQYGLYWLLEKTWDLVINLKDLLFNLGNYLWKTLPMVQIMKDFWEPVKNNSQWVMSWWLTN